MITQDWNIKARSSTCVRCRAAFADGQEYMSRLTFDAGRYERVDCCTPCWQESDRVPGAISIWRGVYEAPPPPPPEPLKKETVESLLRALASAGDPANANTLFVLAVMLERRRLLVEREARAREDGALLRVYEHRKTGDTFIIVDPQLSLDQLGPVQAEVMALLAARAPGGESGSAPPGAPAS